MNHVLKKSSCLLLIFLLIIAFMFTVFAHNGGTDENGGHYDKSTGEYHYHHGYSAHQHENGECPYDFHDNVDHQTGSSSIKPPENTTKHTIDDSSDAAFFKVIFTAVKIWFSGNRDNIICIWGYCIFIPLCAVYLFYTIIKKEHPLWLNISFGISAAISIIVYFLSL